MTSLSRRGLTVLVALAVLTATLLAGARPTEASVNRCNGFNLNRLRVPGAEMQKVTCAADLTTAGAVAAGLSQPSDWGGLNAPGTVNPSGVPGIQVDGYFPDTPPASYAPNPFNGWNHDAQFVIRLPEQWNGGVVIAPPPGNRRQYSSDFIISDWVLAKGYAYASTDKGNWGAFFFRDGQHPGDAVAEWHDRISELTKATRRVVRQRYGRNPDTVLLFGISNGGYMVRYALENSPGLYDGGVDWEGTLFTRNGPNLFTYLPDAMRNGRVLATTGATPEQIAAAQAGLLAGGFPDGSQLLWPLHYSVYWDLTQRIYREEFDPDWDGPQEPFIFDFTTGQTVRCDPADPLCDANYIYAERPDSVKDAVERVSLSGRIKRPLITVQGTLDSLLPPATNADPYAQLIADRNRTRLHRDYRVEGGQHVDSFVANPAFAAAGLEPVLPCAREAFEALEEWVCGNVEPPASGLIPRASVSLNECALP